MDSSIFSPIGRVTYLIGIIVLYASSLVVNFSLSNSPSYRLIIPLILFLGLAGIIWDYKRIIDISKKQSYLLLLFISIIVFIVNVLSFLENHKFTSFFSGSNFQLSKILFLSIFSLISFCYQLFLIFKKGSTSAAVLTSVETKTQ